MSMDFARQDRETQAAIGLVISRSEAPSLFRSFAEYLRELANAYQARDAFWDAVVKHVIGHGCDDLPREVVFSALLDARSGCNEKAWQTSSEARDSARRDQERAFASYADNITAARAGAVVAHSGMAA
jgi:hypothetical protein